MIWVSCDGCAHAWDFASKRAAIAFVRAHKKICGPLWVDR